MLHGMSPLELAAAPPFPFPKELFPEGTFPAGIKFAAGAADMLPPSVEALLGTSEGHALGAMFSAAADAHMMLPDWAVSDDNVPLTEEEEMLQKMREDVANGQPLPPELQTMLQHEAARCGVPPEAMLSLLLGEDGSSGSESDQDVKPAPPPRPAKQEPANEQHQGGTASSTQHREKGVSCSVPENVEKDWFTAAKCGAVPILQRLLQRHPTLHGHRSPGIGNTALHWAAAKGNADAVALLLQQPEVACNERNACGSTALHGAASHGHEAALRCLLAHPSIDCAVMNEDGATAEALAREHGHMAATELLQQRQHLQPLAPDVSAPVSSPCRQAPVPTGLSTQARPSAETEVAPERVNEVGEQNCDCSQASSPAGAQAQVTSRRDTGRSAAEAATSVSAQVHPTGEVPRTEAGITADTSSSGTSSSGRTVPDRGAAHRGCKEWIPAHEEVLWVKQVDWPSLVTCDTGMRWLTAAKEGQLAPMKKLLKQHHVLLVFRGKGTPLGLCGTCLSSFRTIPLSTLLTEFVVMCSL